MFDFHNDFSTAIDRAQYAEYLSRTDDVITSVIWTSEFDRSGALEKVSDITKNLECIDSMPIAIEDIGFLSGNICEFAFEKYFYCSLTWNYDNRFAGGALDGGSLTSDGRAAIAAMNGKCAVDLAHLNKRSFYAALDLAQNPICSHTGFAEHPRCLDDGQIRALIARNAPIGLCAVTAFTGANTAMGLAEVIDRFVQRYGIDFLCIGTDFNGSADLPEDFKDYSDTVNLRNALSSLGYGDGDIKKIFYDNAYNFYEELKQ